MREIENKYTSMQRIQAGSKEREDALDEVLLTD